VGKDGAECVWELPGAPETAEGDPAEGKTPEELVELAEVLSGRRLGANEERTDLDVRGLRSDWEKLHPGR
jgi:hypothetical protein